MITTISRRLAPVTLALTLTLGTLLGTALPTLAQESDPISLRVGVSPVPHAEILRFVQENLAPDAGLEIEIVEFTDYVQPNLALEEGELDANYFQHVPYMEDFGEEQGIDLVAVAAVHIEPLGIYSADLDDLASVPDGGTVAIPNDVTNAGRALLLLQANGLITVDPEAGIEPTVDDITDNPKDLEIVELEAAQLPRSLEDTDISVINGNYAIEADLDPTSDALAIESAENNPYANVLAVNAGHENDPGIQELATLLTSPEVQTFIADTYQGAVIPAIATEDAGTPETAGTPSA